MYALDLRIDPDGSLDSVRFGYDRGGRDTTVAGMPAWSSDDGLFVDIGGRLLVVQPVFFLSDATPDPVPAQAAVAELAAPARGRRRGRRLRCRGPPHGALPDRDRWPAGLS